jgi:hypothetical protein
LWGATSLETPCPKNEKPTHSIFLSPKMFGDWLVFLNPNICKQDMKKIWIYVEYWHQMLLA